MAFDFKKEYKEFYLPPQRPALVEVPRMRFLAVPGQGDPNEPEGAYGQAMQLLYGMAYTLKMSPRSGHSMQGYFDYAVPPLEGLWWQDEAAQPDYAHKQRLRWISLIRLPDFVTEADVAWARAAAKKKADFSPVQVLVYDEGLCVQCMHVGAYDAEPETLAAMAAFAQEQGCAIDITPTRFHHEIYLSDPRRTQADKLKTVLRHPVRRV